MRYIDRVEKCVATNNFVVGVGNDQKWNSVTYIDPITMQSFGAAHVIKAGDLYYRFTKDKAAEAEDLNGVAFATAREGNESPMATRTFSGYRYEFDDSWTLPDKHREDDFSLVQMAVDKYVNNYEEESNMTNILKGMFGRIDGGMCRLTFDGKIAVKAGGDFKYYDPNTGAFINADQFVFDPGEEMFFVIPTNNVQVGDIILAGGKPRYVLGVQPNRIEVLNYEGGSVETIIPERHMFMGQTYFYGKIMSMFGNMADFAGGTGANNIMKYYMMTQMMKGWGNTGCSDGMNPMMMMMFMQGGMGNMFDNLFSAMNPPTPAAPMTAAPADTKEVE